MRMEPKSEASVSQNPCSLLWFISNTSFRVYNPQLECVNYVKMGSYYLGSVASYFLNKTLLWKEKKKKKIRDTKGTFHAKMGSIKDRNGLDLTEA